MAVDPGQLGGVRQRPDFWMKVYSKQEPHRNAADIEISSMAFGGLARIMTRCRFAASKPEPATGTKPQCDPLAPGRLILARGQMAGSVAAFGWQAESSELRGQEAEFDPDRILPRITGISAALLSRRPRYH
jgi:hypothetical protein